MFSVSRFSVPMATSLRLGLTVLVWLLLGLACAEGDKSFGVSSEMVVARAEFPVALAFAPDGRLFYNELKQGNIRVVTPDGRLLDEPFASIPVAVDTEAGLLGLAIDPDFESNHFIYVYYTEPVQARPVIGKPIVMRFTETNNRGIDPTIIIGDLPQTPEGQGSQHVAGNVHFGPDGYLYVTIGDYNLPSISQELDSAPGKILRVNKEDGSAAPDNPFINDPDADPRIFAYGLRNSFDFAFHPRSGDIYATENGPVNCDELNIIKSGKDYGHPRPYQSGSCDVLDSVSPIYLFAQKGKKPWDEFSTVAPAGIEFVSASVYPALGDSLLTCEYLTGIMRRLVLEEEEPTSVAHDDIVVRDCKIDIAVSPDGIIYYSNDTEIRRLVPIASPTP